MPPRRLKAMLLAGAVGFSGATAMAMEQARRIATAGG